MLTIFIIVLIALAGLAAYASQRPDEFRVSRSTVMNAPVETVFDQVNDLRKWNAWSPWARLDPNALNTFEGPAAGIGASMSWAGNHKVGQGIMTITDSKPSQFIQFRLEFKKPMKATNTSEFTFTPDGSKTNVTWNMYGKNNLISKMMSVVFNCEKMVGGQFEEGLSNLRGVVEV